MYVQAQCGAAVSSTILITIVFAELGDLITRKKHQVNSEIYTV